MTDALWAVVIVNFLGMLTVWGKAYFDYKAKKAVARKIKSVVKETVAKNPNSVPGKGEKCIDHGERLIGIETDIEYIKEDIGEMKDDIKKLRNRKR